MKTGELIAAVEAGGTKFNCAIGTGPDDIRSQVRIETTTPTETLREMMEYLEHAAREHGHRDGSGAMVRFDTARHRTLQQRDDD